MRRLNINEDFTIKFNGIRQKLVGRKMDKRELINIFKTEMNFNLNSCWLKYLLKYGVLERVRSGFKHAFVFSYTPCHIQKLQIIQKEVLNYQNSHKMRKEPQACTDPVNQETEVVAAIKLLKENGYKILKQTVTYEEI